MSNEAAGPELVEHANVSLVRDEAGILTVWVGGRRMLGVNTITVHPLEDGTSLMTVSIPSTRFAIAERAPAPSAYEMPMPAMDFRS
jgi:hypothetical protein